MLPGHEKAVSQLSGICRAVMRILQGPASPRPTQGDYVQGQDQDQWAHIFRKRFRAAGGRILSSVLDIFILESFKNSLQRII